MATQILDSLLIEDFIAEDMYDVVNGEASFLPRDQLVFKIFGKTIPLPRDKAFHGFVHSNGSTPLYRYGGGYYPIVNPWTPAIKQIRDQIEENIGFSNNHVVVNRYLSGNDHIGYHHDKTKDFVLGTSVCTVSFGGTRTFRLKHIVTKNVITIELKSGSLFVLGPETNRLYKHSIVKTAGICDPRISLTFRNIQTKRATDGSIIL